MVTNCVSCSQSDQRQIREPTGARPTPNRSEEIVTMDIFYHVKGSYFSVLDDCRIFLESGLLKTETISMINNKLREKFTQHGIAIQVISVDGLTFAAQNSNDFQTRGTLNIPSLVLTTPNPMARQRWRL